VGLLSPSSEFTEETNELFMDIVGLITWLVSALIIVTPIILVILSVLAIENIMGKVWKRKVKR